MNHQPNATPQPQPQPTPPPPPPPPSSSPPPSPSASPSPSPSPSPQASSPISIQLYFDPSLENQVLKSWNSLARRQISTTLIDASSRPHLNLLTFVPPTSLADPSKLLPPLRSLASRLDPLPLTLSCVSALPNEPTLFLSPTPTLPLLHLHSQLADLARKEVWVPDLPEEWRPDAWVPRCDVAREVPRGRLSEGVQVLREMKLPVSGYAVEVGVVEGTREIGVVTLGNSADQ